MKIICGHCNKENPMDAKYCIGCGNFLDKEKSALSTKKRWISRIPAWAWIIIVVAGVAAFILGIMGSFWVLGSVEGVGSLLMFIVGALSFGAFKATPFTSSKATRAIAIGFYALMGMAIDQTGNYIYNKPAEICFCKDGSSLNRDLNILHPTPGRTDLIQEFACVKNGTVINHIPVLAVIGIRFLEYMLLGYLFIGLRWLRWKIKIF